MKMFMPSVPKATTMEPELVRAMWEELPHAPAEVGKVMRRLDLHPRLVPYLRLATSGPMAPTGLPALVYRYETQAQPWSGLSTLPLGKDLRMTVRAPVIVLAEGASLDRVSVRFGPAGKRLSVTIGLPLALQMHSVDSKPVWSFMPSLPAVLDEIPATCRRVDVYLMMGLSRTFGPRIIEELERRGHRAALYTVGF
jgi:hypothetical protein